MLYVRKSANAANDILEIAAKDSKGAAGVFALINEMNSNELLQDMMLERKGLNVPWSSQRWLEAYKEGYNLYRIKEVDFKGFSTNKYRVIYGYITEKSWRTECYVILAVVERDKFNYELHHPISKRIISDYEGLL